MDFWDAVAAQVNELKSATTAKDVVAILSRERNPYGAARTIVADGFYAGGTGDDILEVLGEAGWKIIWIEADYYFAMLAPDNSAITYIEGDVYARNLREKLT